MENNNPSAKMDTGTANPPRTTPVDPDETLTNKILVPDVPTRTTTETTNKNDVWGQHQAQGSNKRSKEDEKRKKGQGFGQTTLRKRNLGKNKSPPPPQATTTTTTAAPPTAASSAEQCQQSQQ